MVRCYPRLPCRIRSKCLATRLCSSTASFIWYKIIKRINLNVIGVTFIVGLIAFITYSDIRRAYLFGFPISSPYFDWDEAKYNYCSLYPQNLKGPVTLNLTTVSMADVEIALASQGIGYGGSWKPTNCEARHYAAVLIPVRDREEHLRWFLLNMHPIFARQNLAYKIYIIEPYGNITFNRGLLFNIGFTESNKDAYGQWRCHVFHDVDLLSEDDRTLFYCPRKPYHLAHFINKYNYKVNYRTYFGGANVMRKEHYQQINGFSNLYFGWGKEDDDEINRIYNKYIYAKYPQELPIGKYYMHKHDGAAKNPKRHELYYFSLDRMDSDGLNSLQYEVISREETPLYTKYIVYYDEKKYLQDIEFGKVTFSYTD